MQKISNIIPANARTRSVDVSRAQPVRPGAPTWGRPEGRVTRTVEDKVSLSNEMADRAIESPTYRNIAKNSADLAKMKIAHDVSRNFEVKSNYSVAKDSGSALSEDLADSVNESSFSSVSPLSSNDDME